MPTITAKVMYVNPPKTGQRYGSIKTDDPDVVRISMPYADLAKFDRGRIYTLEYQTTPEGYHNFVGLVSESKPRPVPMAPRGEARVQPSPRQSPRPGQGGEKDARNIFVTGVVGRAMGSGKFVIEDITLLTTWAADAYDKVLGPPRLPLTPPAPVQPRRPAPSPYNGRQGSEPAGPRDDVPYQGEDPPYPGDELDDDIPF